MLLRKYRIVPVLLIMLGLSLGSLQAQEQDQADKPAGETFNDWGKRCEVLESSGEELCLVFQRIRLKENNRTLLYVTFGYPPAGGGPVMVLATPLGVSLAAGLKVQVDEQGEPEQIPYNVCLADGCRASLLVSDQLLAAMKGGKMLKVAFANVQNKTLGLMVSLDGFEQASESLNP